MKRRHSQTQARHRSIRLGVSSLNCAVQTLCEVVIGADTVKREKSSRSIRNFKNVCSYLYDFYILLCRYVVSLEVIINKQLKHDMVKIHQLCGRVSPLCRRNQGILYAKKISMLFYFQNIFHGSFRLRFPERRGCLPPARAMQTPNAQNARIIRERKSALKQKARFHR